MTILTLTIQLTNEPRAAINVIDGLHDVLYELAASGAIDDADDDGWAYTEEKEA